LAVQTGEGTIDIIYGSTSIPAGPQTLSGYLARPDGEGEWPTVVLFGPEPLPESSVKNICRMFARHGIAGLAPDVTDDHDKNTVIASRIAAFISDPTGTWSNAQFGYGVLAFGRGIHDASNLAARDGRVVAACSVGATLDDAVVEDLGVAQIPMLWIGSRGDGMTDVDESLAHKDAVPQTTFVVHADAGEGFWNDGAAGFDEDTAADTIERFIAFFGSELPPRV
jgi:dienelactone hydrolase